MSVRWSFIHAPSQPPCSPASRQVASSVAQSTRWGEVLNEIRRATAQTASVARAASARRRAEPLVIAPSDAGETSAAYLARAPDV